MSKKDDNMSPEERKVREQIAAFQAQADQTNEGMRQMAKTVAILYKTLVAEGVPRTVAAQVSCQFIASIVSKG